MSDICRLCFDIIPPGIPNSNTKISLITKIQLLMPEIDVSITPTITLCIRCLDSLDNAYLFKCNCIQIEKVIKKYYSGKPVDLKYIRIHEFGDRKNILPSDIKPEANELDINALDLVEIVEEKNIKNSDVTIKNEKNSSICRTLEPNNKTNCFNCNICNQICPDNLSLQKHEENCLQLEWNQCNNACTEKQSKQQNCQLSLKTLVCEICNKIFKTKHGFKKHVIGHNKSEKLYQIHGAVHLERGKYGCKLCKVRFPTLTALRRHERTIHLNEKKCDCDICGKSFNHPDYMRRHILLVHERIKKHECQHCRMKFVAKYNLTEHLRTHTGERPFKCELCGKGFAQSSTLREHRNSIHKNEKPFVCASCAKAFSTKGSLTKHIVALHTENVEKNFMCSYCGKSFLINSRLQRHMNGHLGIKTHYCHICNKGLSGSTKLKLHLRTHTGERPFECDICHKTFSRKGNLQTHFKSHKPKISL